MMKRREREGEDGKCEDSRLERGKEGDRRREI